MRLRLRSSRWAGDDSGATRNGRLAFTFAARGGGRECARDGGLTLPRGARAAAVLVLLLVACAGLVGGVVLLRGRRGCARIAGLAAGWGVLCAAGGVGPVSLESHLHLADACLEGFEFRRLRVDLLLPAWRRDESAIMFVRSVGGVAVGDRLAGLCVGVHQGGSGGCARSLTACRPARPGLRRCCRCGKCPSALARTSGRWCCIGRDARQSLAPVRDRGAVAGADCWNRGKTHDCGRRPLGFQSRSSSSSVRVMAAAALNGKLEGTCACLRGSVVLCGQERCVECDAGRMRSARAGAGLVWGGRS